MIWNIALPFLVFGSAKKKFNPYASAAILGAVKAVRYYVGSQSLIVAVCGFIVFGGLAAAMVYLLARLDWIEAAEEPYPKYGPTKTSGSFRWEYIPLLIIVFLLVFGVMSVALLR